jgi:hypothetical protein
MTTLREDVTELLDASLEEPAEGLTLWSFHIKDLARPLDEDEIVERIASGAGVYAIELVFDEDLELFQRGSGRKVKSHADLRALKRERFEAMAPRASSAPLQAPTDTKAKRSTPLHGALLGKSLGPSGTGKGAKRGR